MSNIKKSKTVKSKIFFLTSNSKKFDNFKDKDGKEFKYPFTTIYLDENRTFSVFQSDITQNSNGATVRLKTHRWNKTVEEDRMYVVFNTDSKEKVEITGTELYKEIVNSALLSTTEIDNSNYKEQK